MFSHGIYPNSLLVDLFVQTVSALHHLGILVFTKEKEFLTVIGKTNKLKW